MGKRTALYDLHLQSKAKIIDFGGWDMPLHYGSQVNEHHQIRQHTGIFDVSHMTIIDLRGEQVSPFLRYLLANDIAKLKQSGKALYSCMLNHQGGIIDDLIVYYISPQWFRLVVNASTREKDLAWIQQQASPYTLTVTERPELAMLAIQGSQVRQHITSLFPNNTDTIIALGKFFAHIEGDYFIARTGYTGEEGFEVICSAEQAKSLWHTALQSDIKPCGLGARDTLRLEAGMNLYGSDMDENTLPWESALGWTVALQDQNRDFIGKTALLAAKEKGISQRLVGLVLLDKGVLRNHQKVFTSSGEGEITSGSFSPTLAYSIAFARIPAGNEQHCEVEIRNRRLRAKIISPPFVRNGAACIDITT